MSNVLVLLPAVSYSVYIEKFSLFICYYILLVPNPINGCLCEVILSCTCVASHLQEVKEDTNSSVYTTSPTLDTSSCCSTPPPPPPTTTTTTTTTTTSIAMAAPLDFDQPTDNQKTSPILLQSVQDDHEDLMNFLINDLDKYLATPHEENTTI
jgi:hypothetical protein